MPGMPGFLRRRRPGTGVAGPQARRRRHGLFGKKKITISNNQLTRPEAMGWKEWVKYCSLGESSAVCLLCRCQMGWGF